MEDSQEILLNSLRNSGVLIPHAVSAIQELTPATLFSICSQSLILIDNTLSFPTSLPETFMADRFKICSDLASAFQRLGFIGDISFHKFLYPSEEDLYKFVRFLVGKLAESSEAQKAPHQKESSDETIPQIKQLRLETQSAELADDDTRDALVIKSDSSLRKLDNVDDGGSEKVSVASGLDKDLRDKVEVAEGNASGSEESVGLGVDYVFKDEQKQTSHQEYMFEEKLPTELTVKTSGLEHLDEEYEILKAAVEMTFDDQHSVDFDIQQLNNLMETKRDSLVKMESQWNALNIPLEEKKRSLEESLCAANPDAQEKLQKKKEIDWETESVLAEIKRREEEFSALSLELDKQPDLASRRSFVERIKEITKNSRKQDADIERVLKDTRELQLESNSILERLNRTYAVVNETVFREARKDPVGRQAYRILTKIHECFEQTAETILATDRTRREVADYEAKLATMASRSLNMDKLRADLGSIRKENDILEQQLRADLGSIRKENDILEQQLNQS